MPKMYNSDLKTRARELRKNMTKEERHLWYDFLKTLDVNVARQEIMGHYIVDFYIPSAKLVIEVDGSQHYEDDGPKKDEERTRFLQDTYGVEIIRIMNTDVNRNFDGVCAYLQETIQRRIHSASPRSRVGDA